MIKNKQFTLLCTALISLLLSACGGGGSSQQPSLQPSIPAPSVGTISPIVDNSTIQIYGDNQSSVGSSTGFALIPKGNATVRSIQWEQISGPNLTILAKNSQTIGFDVSESGNYTLRANVIMNGQSSASSYDVNFSAGSENADATIRLDHTVTELGKVSLHAGTSEKTIESVNWEQVAGPQAQNVQTSNDFLFFDAPAVSSDSVMVYRANITFDDSSTATDDVYITVKNVNFDQTGLFFGNDDVITEDMYAYRPNSPYKNALERCVYNNNIPNPPTCTFNDLPLVGTQTNAPSVDDIMNRTLVSHDWMGQRFEEYLQQSAAGPDMLLLLRGVTAVVISYEVRPSFYWAATGAIYLDANNFWQSPTERDTLNDQPDFRTDFGSDLQFRVLWRYTKDNDYYPKARIDKQNRVERDFSDVEASISWLMYHELAHANDFFPPTSWPSMDANTTPLAYFRRTDTNTSSDVLDSSFPLRSDEMHALAQVRFRNDPATDVQKGYSGADVETFFTPDISASFYSYLTIREDFATLVERYMMLYRLESEADVAIIDGTTADDEPLLVVWGQRNRISLPSLEDRTVFAVNRVYPELNDVRTTLRDLPSPILMTPNQGWLENLEISPSADGLQSNTRSRSNDVKIKFSKNQLQQLLQRDSKYIHDGKPIVLK